MSEKGLKLGIGNENFYHNSQGFITKGGQIWSIRAWELRYVKKKIIIFLFIKKNHKLFLSFNKAKLFSINIHNFQLIPVNILKDWKYEAFKFPPIKSQSQSHILIVKFSLPFISNAPYYYSVLLELHQRGIGVFLK